VQPDSTGSRHVDHRISTYQPKALVARHGDRVDEQIYYVLEGRGADEIGADRRAAMTWSSSRRAWSMPSTTRG